MSITEQQIQATLKELIDANTGKDFVSGRTLRNLKVDGANVSLDIELGYPAQSQFDSIRKQVQDKLASLPEANQGLRAGMTLAHLRALAMALTDMQAAEELNDARQALFRRVPARTA